jgi:hypothetical protein
LGDLVKAGHGFGLREGEAGPAGGLAVDADVLVRVLEDRDGEVGEGFDLGDLAAQEGHPADDLVRVDLAVAGVERPVGVVQLDRALAVRLGATRAAIGLGHVAEVGQPWGVAVDAARTPAAWDAGVVEELLVFLVAEDDGRGEELEALVAELVEAGNHLVDVGRRVRLAAVHPVVEDFDPRALAERVRLRDRVPGLWAACVTPA